MLKILIALLVQPAGAVIGGQASDVYPEVVKLQSGERVCTGTIIGPRVVLSAAHCATGDASYFIHRGKTYKVNYVKSAQAEEGHDISLAIAEESIEGAQIANVGAGIEHGSRITLAGYGCTQKGGRPGGLHIGESRVIGIDQDHFLSGVKRGSVLCEGDSGGPAFLSRGGRRLLIAVNSLSNVRNLNINVRIDSELTRRFLMRVARLKQVAICGVSGC